MRQFNIRALILLVAVKTACCTSLAAAAPPSTPNELEREVCTGSWAIFDTDDQTHPSPKIQIVKQLVSSRDDLCVKNAIEAQNEALRSKIKIAAIDSFANSPLSFEFAVGFALTEKEPATFQIFTRDMPPEAKAPLKIFRNKMKAFTDFHSKFGTVNVTMQYRIGASEPLAHNH